MNSTAYRFDLFEEQPKKKVIKNKPPELKVIKSKKRVEERRKILFLNVRKETLQGIKIITTSTLCLVAFFSILYQNSKIDELHRERQKIENEIAISQSVTTKLESDIQKDISLDTIEKYVRDELGMSKIQKYQICYVDLSDEDKVVLYDD